MYKIFVAGHNGMVGSAICNHLKNLDVDIITASRQDLDLTNQVQVKDFFSTNKFDQVFLAAAKVGGIHANNMYPASFIYENLMIQNNIIHQCYKSRVNKLLFLGSSCIYPKLAKQPISETDLLNGHLEPTNEPYAVAKIAGIKMCESYNRQYGTDYRAIMPTNLYGPGDNYHPENSHVIPALIQRFHEAKESKRKEVIAWGSGNALREFMFSDDLASAAVFIMNLDKQVYKSKCEPMNYHINVGSGIECSIKELTKAIAKTVGFKGNIKWDLSKPDGAPRKIMNSKKIQSFGWNPSVNLMEGLNLTYMNYLKIHRDMT